MEEFVFDGVTVRTDGPRGVIYWMSDWARAYELSEAGYLTRVFHPGHGDPYAQYEEYFVDVARTPTASERIRALRLATL